MFTYKVKTANTVNTMIIILVWLPKIDVIVMMEDKLFYKYIDFLKFTNIS